MLNFFEYLIYCKSGVGNNEYAFVKLQMNIK